MKKSLIALAFGTLGLGIAEFTMMGILPYVAQDLGISIPVAGHLISAYALGVCCGAPMLILARKRPLKQTLLYFGAAYDYRKSLCFCCSQLLGVNGWSFYIRSSARCLFRCGIHCSW